ncbi:MAG: class II fructose-bisphosphatase [Alphaproteobacteria bacterium]|nr:class II fructose-bisphosphatase [Alphaproteobacteria bacterium]
MESSRNLSRIDPLFERNLSLEAVRISEAAAINCWPWVGKGDQMAADRAAVAAMRRVLNNLTIDGTVVIGEGERDNAPMLYVGERVGCGGESVDIAVDPLEGTQLAANNASGSMAVIAFAEHGGFLHAPDVYMKKIAYRTPDGRAIEGVSVRNATGDNLQRLAKGLGKPVDMIHLCVLDRPRHAEIIATARENNCRVTLIPDGDITAVIAAVSPSNPIDCYIGTGGAPEGVLAAAAVNCLGGVIEGQLLFSNEDDVRRARNSGIDDLDRLYSLPDLARGKTTFTATGVTDGPILRGVHEDESMIRTFSVAMRSHTGTVRFLAGEHNIRRKPFPEIS